MGLKGKIEAIIYAADEPITLEQIAVLVKDPVLQELAEEKDRATAAAAESAAANEATAVEAEDVKGFIAAEGGVADAQTEGSNDSEPGSAPVESAVGNTVAQDVQAEPTQVVAAESALAQTSEVIVETAETTSPKPSLDGAPTAEGERQKEEGGTETTPPNEHPADAQASESAEPTVAPKRRAKVEIPPEVKSKVRALIEELITEYSSTDRGMEIRNVAGGYRMATKPEHHDVVKAFAKSLKPPFRLSLPALETLAVIAYKQPVTAPEVSEVRSVDSQGVIATLLDRKLVTTAGRKAVIGRPILYKTTKDFLLRFGLKDISELPSMEEFEKLAQEAGQVDMFERPEDAEQSAATAEAITDSAERGDEVATTSSEAVREEPAQDQSDGLPESEQPEPAQKADE